MPISLTERHREVLEFIVGCEFCPTYDEIAAGTGRANKSTVARILGALEERGYIRRLKNRPCSIKVLVQPPPKLRVVAGPGYWDDLARRNREKWAAEAAA